MLFRSIQLFLLFFAITPNFGFYSDRTFLLLTLVVLMAIVNLFFYKNSFHRPSPLQPSLLYVLFVILFLYSWSVYGGYYQDKASIAVGKFFYAFSLVILLLYSTFSAQKRHLLTLLIGSFTILSWWTIQTSPNPLVDVFVILREAPQKLLQGINPYDTMYSQVYPTRVPDYYTYLPFTFLYTLPFVVLLGDPRYGILFAHVLIVLLIYTMFRKQKNEVFLALILMFYLLLPRSFFIVEHSYIDPLIFLTYLLYLYFHRRGRAIAFLFFSLFFTIKLNIVVLLPYLIQSIGVKNLCKKTHIILLSIPFIIVVIFFLWNKQAFLNDIIFVFIPRVSENPPALLSNSLPIFLYRKNVLPGYYFSITIGSFLFIVLAIITYIRVVPITTKIYSLLLFFTYFHFTGFYNHYYLVSEFLLLDMLANSYESQHT